MNARRSKRSKDLDGLEKMIEEITVEAYGDDEQLWAFRQAFEDEVELPADGFVIGVPVSIMTVDYDGNARRGLTARCRREDGSEHTVAVSEVEFPQNSVGIARYASGFESYDQTNPTQIRAPKMRSYCFASP